jgi:hypothetical protein
MQEIVKQLLALSGELKEIKVHLQYLKKTRAELFREAWLDGEEIIQALHISKRTLHTLRKSGTLPFSRLNGKYYYKLSDLERLLEANYSSSKSKGHGNK